MSTNTIHATYADRIYEIWRLIYLSISNGTNPVMHTLSSSTLTGTGSTTAGVYVVVRFYNPDTNANAVLVNNVSLLPGTSRTYYVEKPDTLGSISYDTGTQTIYVEYMT